MPVLAAGVPWVAATLGVATAGAAMVTPRADAATLQVERVEVVGAVRTHPDRVRFIVGAREGRRFSADTLREAVSDDCKAIDRLGPFEVGTRGDILPGSAPDRFVVRFQVVELPMVSAVRFANAGSFGQDALRKLIATRPGGHLGTYALDNDRRALERRFQEDGHRSAKVTAQVVEDPPGSGLVTVTFTIDRGPSLNVGSLVFEGLDAETEHLLRRTLAKPRYRLFNSVGAPYQAELMDGTVGDRTGVIRALQDQGYLLARLVSCRVEITDDVRPNDPRRRHGPRLVPDGERNDRTVIIYAIDPGVRFRLGSVAFVGATLAGQAELLEAFIGPPPPPPGLPRTGWLGEVAQVVIGPRPNQDFRFAPGDFFVAERLYGSPDRQREDGGDLGALERAKRVISNQGRARCEAVANRRLDLVRHEVHLTVQIEEGGLYQVGRVDIRGNDTTQDGIIRRALYLHPGERWNEDDLDESQRQLERIGLFKQTPTQPLRIERFFPRDRPGEVDLRVDVREAETASLSVSGGYSTATGVFAQLGYRESNFDIEELFTGRLPFRGGGQSLDISANVSEKTRGVTSGWTQPHLFDGPWSLSVNANYGDSTLRQWDERRISTGAGVGRRFLDNDLTLSLGYSYTDIEISRPTVYAYDDVVAGSLYLNTLRMAASYDRLNNRVFPSDGLRLTIAHEVSGVGLSASDPVYEWNARLDRFWPLARHSDGGSTTLHLSAAWREALAIDGETHVPFYQRFMGGGPSPRHRGYDFNGLGPQAINRNGNLSDVGGTRDGLITTEVLFPIQGTDDGLKIVVFADYGYVWGERQAVDARDLRTAIGFGIRFPMQLPVMLDFAWPINAREGDPGFQTHFAIGAARY